MKRFGVLKYCFSDDLGLGFMVGLRLWLTRPTFVLNLKKTVKAAEQLHFLCFLLDWNLY